MRIPLFRIWYSTTYTTIFIILVLLLAITPGDMMYQSIKTRDIQKLFIIGGVCLLAVLIALLVYSTRIYTNRTILQAIPKGYLPIEEGEVGKGVRRMIIKHLRRSAIVAWDCRPRDVRGEVGVSEEDAKEMGGAVERAHTAESRKDREKTKIKTYKKKLGHHHAPDAIILPVSARSPPWGHVSHPGWASPSSPDLPNLKYCNVICELPNLIEAKAVSLAPPDPALEASALLYPSNGPPLPDAQIVTMLQRPRAMALREYLGRLSQFGLLNPPSLGPAFLAQYEYARFSTSSLTETEFRDLMAIFADILNGMMEIDPAVIEQARAQNTLYDNDARSLAPTELSTTSSSDTTVSSHNRPLYRTPLLHRTISTSSSNDHDHDHDTESLSSADGAQTVRTAPSRQQRRSAMFTTPRTSSDRSIRSFSDTGSVMIHSVTRRSPSTILPNSSSDDDEASLRSAQSVIRLRLSPSAGDLPYEYHGMGG